MTATAEREPPLTIIVVAGRDDPDPLPTLASLTPGRAGVDGEEVVVVLSDPPAGRVEAARRELPAAVIEVLSGDPGYAAAANLGADRAGGDYLLLLDAGALIEPGTLDALLGTARRRSGCGLVAGRTVALDGDVLEAGPVLWADGTLGTLAGPEGRRPFDFERRIDVSAGAALLVRRSLWEQVDGLDGVYVPTAALEKLDLCLRAGELGWATWYQPAAAVTAPPVTGGTNTSAPDEDRQSLFTGRWAAALAAREKPGRWERAVWRAMGEPLRVLVIDDEMPDPRRGMGYGRMHDVLQVLDEEPGIQVGFHPRIPPLPDQDLDLAGAGNRVVIDVEGHLASEGVDYDIVAVSRPPNAEIFRPMIERRLPGRPVIYDAEAIFFLRLERQAQLAPEAERSALLAAAAASRDLELDLVAWADSVVCISNEEATIFRTATDAPVHVVGPRLRTAGPTTAPFEQRSGGCLVASWSAGPASPNVDGLRWLARDVLPRVWAELPGFRLLVSGDNPPGDVNWVSGPGIEFVGGLPDVSELYDRVRVAVSPTRFGAGVKLKTVEAVQLGVPVVCTAEAATGLTPDLAAAVWVGADAGACAAAIVALASDRRVWERARARALRAAGRADELPPGVEEWPTIVRMAAASGRHERVPA